MFEPFANPMHKICCMIIADKGSTVCVGPDLGLEGTADLSHFRYTILLSGYPILLDATCETGAGATGPARWDKDDMFHGKEVLPGRISWRLA